MMEKKLYKVLAKFLNNHSIKDILDKLPKEQ